MNTMKAVVFHGVNDIRVEEVAKPRPKAGQAVIRITATTICGTDVHIVRGEYPVRPGLILGHEPVGVIEELGEGLEGEYTPGQRVIVGASTPCGQCFYCLNGAHSQCHGALGGWRFGNTINGAWAEYLQMLERTWRLCLTNSPTSRSSCFPISRRQVSRVRRAATSKRATALQSSRKVQSGCVRPWVPSSEGRADHRRRSAEGAP